MANSLLSSPIHRYRRLPNYDDLRFSEPRNVKRVHRHFLSLLACAGTPFLYN